MQAEHQALLAPGAQASGRKRPILPELGPVPRQGPARAARRGWATAPSPHSARHGPRSRGGRTPQSPRKARRGHPRRAGASGRAGSGKGPRQSWSCCSGCACWWTAGSGSGSGWEHNRGKSVVGRGVWPAPQGTGHKGNHEGQRPDVLRGRGKVKCIFEALTTCSSL